MRFINELMSRHTTLKIGGVVETLSIPESEDELISEINHCRLNNIPYHILGNGSNILVHDDGLKGFVIKTTKACTELNFTGNEAYVGASVSLQNFIKSCVRNSLEGLEYLYSVPATLGGAIFMNAGRGRSYHMEISDRLSFVRYYDGTSIKELPKDECCFSYRYSIFHKHREWLILGAKFKLKSQDSAIGELKIKERMDFVAKYQNREYPSVGSIFKKANPRILNALKGKKIGGAQFSKKTQNWIINTGGAKASDVIKLVKKAEFYHKLFFQKAIPEIELWS